MGDVSVHWQKKSLKAKKQPKAVRVNAKTAAPNPWKAFFRGSPGGPTARDPCADGPQGDPPIGRGPAI